MTVQPFLLSPLVDQLTGFGKFYALAILKNVFTSYVEIDKIGLEENAVKMMVPYDPVETLARLIKQLGKGVELVRAVG